MRRAGARARTALAVAAGATLAGCMSTYEYRHEVQWSSADQIWLSEASQVRLRSAQSRVFDTTDRARMLQALVQVLQELHFPVGVLDEQLGLVSARKFVPAGGPPTDALYTIYESDSLLVFSKAYRTWGPFRHRSDLVRLTVTVRERNARQLVVRASGQHVLRPIEEPEAYQRFFASLERSLFLEAQRDADAAP